MVTLRCAFSGVCVSIDNTFKVGDKATVSEGRGRKRLNVMKGGLLNMISERNNYLGWVMYFVLFSLELANCVFYL